MPSPPSELFPANEKDASISSQFKALFLYSSYACATAGLYTKPQKGLGVPIFQRYHEIMLILLIQAAAAGMSMPHAMPSGPPLEFSSIGSGWGGVFISTRDGGVCCYFSAETGILPEAVVWVFSYGSHISPPFPISMHSILVSFHEVPPLLLVMLVVWPFLPSFQAVNLHYPFHFQSLFLVSLIISRFFLDTHINSKHSFLT